MQLVPRWKQKVKDAGKIQHNDRLRERHVILKRNGLNVLNSKQISLGLNEFCLNKAIPHIHTRLCLITSKQLSP